MLTVEKVRGHLKIALAKARAVVRLVNGELSPDRFPSVIAWERQCYNRPRLSERVMCALNELLDGFGVEIVEDEVVWVDSYYGYIVASYVNKGDSYENTILLDHIRNKYVLTCWGDWVENRGLQQELEKIRREEAAWERRKRLLLALVPEHDRTSCADDNLANKFGDCKRCMLLNIKDEDFWPDNIDICLDVLYTRQ
jgi:hypothetical protein